MLTIIDEEGLRFSSTDWSISIAALLLLLISKERCWWSLSRANVRFQDGLWFRLLRFQIQTKRTRFKRCFVGFPEWDSKCSIYEVTLRSRDIYMQKSHTPLLWTHQYCEKLERYCNKVLRRNIYFPETVPNKLTAKNFHRILHFCRGSKKLFVSLINRKKNERNQLKTLELYGIMKLRQCRSNDLFNSSHKFPLKKNRLTKITFSP